MKNKRLLMISTDRLIFDEKSAVRARQVEYAKDWEELHIVIFSTKDQRGSYKDQVPSDKLQIAPNCWIYSTESFSKYLCPFDAIRIGKEIITKNKITDITCQDASLTAMAGLALKKRYKVQLEIQIHEDLSSPYYTHSFTNKIRKRLAYRYLPKANKVRVVSERLKDFVVALIEKRMNGKRSADHYRMPEIEVRPIAVDTKSIKDAPILIDLHRKYRQFDKIVLMASRFEKEKNIELAIKAWPNILESIPGAGLLIVGQGGQKEAFDLLIYKLGLSKNILIENWADKPTLISYYKTADLFLNTSLSEGYGMTLVEAHAAGSKIISTDVGIAMEVRATIIENDAKVAAKKIIEILK